MTAIPTITTAEVLARYDVILLDAYGVLNDHEGALPGAPAFIDLLNRTGKPYLLLTNDASRTPETSSRRFSKMGLEIPAHAILTSGLMLPRYVAEHGLEGAPCIVLGPDESRDYVTRAGGKPVPLTSKTEAKALVVCDEAGFDYRPTLDLALSVLYRHFDAGREMQLILANPDVVYPASPGCFGFTSGSIALLLEAGLRVRYPERKLRFSTLGKPGPRLFEAARDRYPHGRMVMLGDQMGTDVRGARAYGLDAVLVGSGMVRVQDLTLDSTFLPTYVMESL